MANGSPYLEYGPLHFNQRRVTLSRNGASVTLAPVAVVKHGEIVDATTEYAIPGGGAMTLREIGQWAIAHAVELSFEQTVVRRAL